MLPPGAWVAFFGVGLFIAAFLLWRLVQCKNMLSWEDLVSTNDVLNAYKIGYWIGVGVGSWAVIKTTYMGQLDGAVFAGYLAFCGGVPVGMSAISSRTVQPKYRARVDDDDLPPVPPPAPRSRSGLQDRKDEAL